MTHRTARGRLGLLGVFATALALFAAVVALRPLALGATAPTASTVPAWTGTFDNFHTPGWNSAWGTTSDTAQCAGASGTFTCNWGYSNMQAVNDASAPGSGQALKVTYPANSGPPSCYLTVSGCVLGGGQFYQDLTANGQSALAQSPTLDLKYSYEFPVGFDFGGQTAGKLPGLWGGGVPGCESGAQHCAQGWSTRYMWKGGSSTAPNGELYFYTASGSGFGADLCNGKWHFPADGKWHSIEQLVNVQTGSITIWSDGADVCQATEPLPGANSGVFFSTFHGGHDLSYSPKKTVTSEFADFTLSTDGPQGPSPSPSASPSPSPSPSPSASATTGVPGGGLTVSLAKTKDWGTGYTDTGTVKNTSGSAITGWNVQFDLDSSENVESSANVSYASSTHHYTLTNIGTDATIAAGASQTFQFSGDYSSKYIAPTNVAAYAQGGSQSPATPTGLTVTGTTSSSIGLSWSESNNGDPAASYEVSEGGPVVATVSTTSATISGLSPGSTHTYTVTALDAAGNGSAQSAPVTGTTPGTGGGGGGGGAFSQTDIDSAAAAPLIAFAKPTSAVPRPGTNPVNIGSAKVLYYLALVDRQAPGSKASSGATVDAALLAQIRNLIAGGNEPDADGGLEGWAHAPVAQALLLLKNGPAWSELSAAERNKVTLLEAAMGYAGNYTYNDANNFSSGICGFGNFSKTNNPNYRDGYVDVEAAAIQFFGASAWDAMLTGFDDATVAAQLNAAGLTNAGGCFAAVGSAANTPIKRAFVYSGVHSSNLMGLWSVLAADTFDQTVTSVNGPAHIADNTTSPEQGKFGMGHEFNSTDSQGLRSSALYTFEGWMNVTGNRVAMSALGDFACTGATSAAQYNVGSLDLIYKLHHGYISHALNQNDILVDDHGDPATDGPNVKGYQYDLDAYNVLVATQGC